MTQKLVSPKRQRELFAFLEYIYRCGAFSYYKDHPVVFEFGITKYIFLRNLQNISSRTESKS